MPEASTMATGHGNVRTCTVQLLDDVAIQVEFKKSDLGSVIMDQVCNHLLLAERDYFGLRFMDQHLHRYWLDPSKPVLKQVKASDSIVFAFRVKFYPADPTILKEELTRYLLVLQLRRDLLHGRLHCPQNDLANLAAYIVQGEVGDYDPDVHTGNYVSQFKILINQSPKVEEKIIQQHKTLKGETPADVDLNFLKKASSLDTYGYYPYTIKDSKAGQVYMGATPKGVLIYQTSRKLHDIKWDDIENFDYSGKDLYIYPKRAYFDEHVAAEQDAPINADVSLPNISAMERSTERPISVASSFKLPELDSTLNKSSKKKPHLKFICPNSTYSKHMWKYMLAQKAFFTSPKSDQVKAVVKRHFLFRNATFRWHPSNKVLEELRSVQSPPRLKCPTFERQKIPRQANRDERNGPWANKFHTMPARAKTTAAEGAIGVSPPAQSKSSVEAPELGANVGGIRPSILRYENAAAPLTSAASPDAGGGGIERLSPIVTTDAGLASATKTTTTAAAAPMTSTPKKAPLATAIDYVDIVPTSAFDGKPAFATANAVSATTTGVTSVGAATKTPIAKTPTAKPTTTVARAATSSSPLRRCAATFCRAIFLTLLLAILVATLIVGAMEWRYDRWRRLVDDQPIVDDFRHKVYEPTRRYVCDAAASYF